jgi:hypothetical protein
MQLATCSVLFLAYAVLQCHAHFGSVSLIAFAGSRDLLSKKKKFGKISIVEVPDQPVVTITKSANGKKFAYLEVH